MKVLFRIFSITLCLAVISCSKDDGGNAGQEQDGAILIFGDYAGFCPVDCSDIYLLDETNLFEDVSNALPDNGGFTGDFQLMGESDFLIAQDLFSYFPDELLDETESFIGCPDCVDQGGYFVAFEREGFKQHWFIDTNRDEVPDYLDEFLDKISEKLALLSE